MHSDRSDGSVSPLIVWHYKNNKKGTTRLRNQWFANATETVIEGIISMYVYALPESKCLPFLIFKIISQSIITKLVLS